MRDYGIVTPAFWIGATGKQLRGDVNAQLIAMYLMTSPHSSMTGVFHCPVIYMAHETGLTLEGASKGLHRLCEVGFCEYDEASETVFVVNMASFQIAKSLKPGDNRIAGLKKEVAKMAPAIMRERFIAIYSVAFCLDIQPQKTSPYKAPTKPGSGSGSGSGSGNKQPSRFDDFWEAWPKSERKQDKSKCSEKWKAQKFDDIAETILSDIATKKLTQKWQGGFIETPEVYLDNKRWEDGGKPDDAKPAQAVTVPSKPGIDPTLAALIKESTSGLVKPPSEEVRARLIELSGAKHVRDSFREARAYSPSPRQSMGAHPEA